MYKTHLPNNQKEICLSVSFWASNIVIIYKELLKRNNNVKYLLHYVSMQGFMRTMDI